MIEFLGPIIIVIMLAGFLLLPWLTPLSAVMMLGYSFKRHIETEKQRRSGYYH